MKRKALLNLLVVLVSFCLTAGAAFGQEKNAAKKAEPAAKAQKADAKSEKKTATLIDINSASKQELMTLPGIGDAFSQKIIAGRPYRAKNELIQKNIIPQATYDKVADQIIAKQTPAATAAAADKKTDKKGTPAKK